MLYHYLNNSYLDNIIIQGFYKLFTIFLCVFVSLSVCLSRHATLKRTSVTSLTENKPIITIQCSPDISQNNTHLTNNMQALMTYFSLISYRKDTTYFYLKYSGMLLINDAT